MPTKDAAAASRRVVITGATRGLGRAMVDEFIRRGHIVIGCGRSAQAVADMNATLGAPHRFNAVDVADDVEVAAWAAAVLQAYGPPDLLLNNAALVNRNAPLWQISAEEFGAVIDVNIKGVANVIRHFVPAMVEARHGVIVNFSSAWGRATNADVAPYCATKWAIEGLSRALAQELPPGMASVPLDPGIVDTDMLRLIFDEKASQFGSPQAWVKPAVDLLLGIDAEDNGKPMKV